MNEAAVSSVSYSDRYWYESNTKRDHVILQFIKVKPHVYRWILHGSTDTLTP